MINCYFNESGYYISGNSLEIFNVVTRNNDVTDTEHLYLVLVRLLQELQNTKLKYMSITIYNSTALIEAMNGGQLADVKIKPIRTVLRRNMIPSINGMISFKKMSEDKIAEILLEQRNKLIVPHNIEDNEVFKVHHTQRIKKLRKEVNDANQSKQ